MLPTVTDSASFAPEISIRPIPTAGASSSSPITAIEDESPSPHPAAPDGHQSALKYYTRRPKIKENLQLIYHHLLLSRVFLLIRKLLLI